MNARNEDQKTFWSEEAGPIWVNQMKPMDAALAPVLEAVLEAAKLTPGIRVLDVGCGAGTSTLAAARQVGPEGSATGLDISQTLLALARERQGDLAQLSFKTADAQTHPFEPESVDVILSRFGVMFFDDFNAAFANLHHALAPQGRLAMATWGAIPQNPFFITPAAVCKSLLGPVPRTDPDQPGPFALREASRIETILHAAGFADIQVDARDILLTPAGDAADLAALFCKIGPAERALAYHNAEPEQRSELMGALTRALTAYETPQGMRIPAQINIITARKGA